MKPIPASKVLETLGCHGPGLIPPVSDVPLAVVPKPWQFVRRVKVSMMSTAMGLDCWWLSRLSGYIGCYEDLESRCWWFLYAIDK